MFTRKNGQTASEAAVLVSLLTFFLIITLAAVSDDIAQAIDSRYKDQLRDLADVIEQEGLIAFGSEEGYYHEFTLPPTLNGQPYIISILNSTSLSDVGSQGNITLISVASKRQNFPINLTKVLPRDVRGNLVRGTNTVRKAQKIVVFRPIPLSAAEQAACGSCRGIVTAEQCCDYGYTACCT